MELLIKRYLLDLAENKISDKKVGLKFNIKEFVVKETTRLELICRKRGVLRINNDRLLSLPAFEKLKGTLARIKRRYALSNFKNLDDFENDLSNSRDPTYLYEFETQKNDNNEIVKTGNVVWASMFAPDRVADCTALLNDGTFPKPKFTEIGVIHKQTLIVATFYLTKKKNRYVCKPAITALLINKKKETYRWVYNVILKWMVKYVENGAAILRSKEIISDFEYNLRQVCQPIFYTFFYLFCCFIIFCLRSLTLRS